MLWEELVGKLTKLIDEVESVHEDADWYNVLNHDYFCFLSPHVVKDLLTDGLGGTMDEVRTLMGLYQEKEGYSHWLAVVVYKHKDSTVLEKKVAEEMIRYHWGIVELLYH